MLQGMEALLAAHYGAASAPQQEDTQKLAQMEFFAKTAANNGIDLAKLTEEQINYLWNETFKTAAEEGDKPPFPPKKEEGDKKEDEGEKKEEKSEDEKKAEAEFLQRKEAAAKIAEADFIGRVIAHALWDESDKIAAARAGTAEEPSKEAAMPPQLAKAMQAGKGVAQKGAKAVESVGKKITEKATGVGTHNMKPGHAKAVGGAALGAGAAAAGGAAAGVHHALKKKEGSALDQVAAERAVAKVAADGTYDVDEAVARLNALLTLGVEESSKIASAQNFEGALDIRALELLELAGYPIVWNEG